MTTIAKRSREVEKLWQQVRGLIFLKIAICLSPELLTIKESNTKRDSRKLSRRGKNDTLRPL